MNEPRVEVRKGRNNFQPFSGKFGADARDLERYHPPERVEVNKKAIQTLKKAFEAIPEPERPEALAYLWKLAGNWQGTEKPDLSGRRRYKGYRGDGSGIEYLEKHYGKPEELIEQGIYRQDVEGHDKPLVSRVDLEAAQRGQKSREVLPNIEDKTEARAAAAGVDPATGRAVTKQAGKTVTTAAALRMRKTRKQRREAPADPSPA